MDIRFVVGLVIFGLIGVIAARSLTMGSIEGDWGKTVVATPVGGVEGRGMTTYDRFSKKGL